MKCTITKYCLHPPITFSLSSTNIFITVLKHPQSMDLSLVWQTKIHNTK
jgi:hypothetical protein